MIHLYDDRETLFYCDPPYPHEARGDSKAYGFEMTNEEHQRLAKALHKARAKAAVSGYRCALMDRLYKDWRRTEGPSKQCHSIKKHRVEALWTNY